MRLVTRPDFDGIVCGALITALEDIGSYLFVEPKFMQDGVVDIRHGDIIANLPYHPACSLWFDHHFTNGARASIAPWSPGAAPSAWRRAPPGWCTNTIRRSPALRRSAIVPGCP